jgi:HEPN domain-containing protein
MKPKPVVEARRWLDQARSDLAFAELGVREGYPAQACFMCQQAGEKAFKALRYLAGERLVIGHSMVELLGALLPRHGELADLQEAARRLDQYYVPTRYPNGLPGGVPAEMFSRAQATEAVALARQIVERSAALIGG